MTPLVSQHQVTAFTTPQNGDPGNADTVRNNTNTLLAGYDAHDADGTIHVQSSTLASRPAAGTTGRKWVTKDTDDKVQLWYDNGTTWDEVLSTTFAVDNGAPALYDAGNSGASLAIDWKNGPVQKVTLTGNATLTFTNPVAGGSYCLILVQDGTGGRTVSLTGFDFGTGSVAYNTNATRKNVVSAVYDGSEYLAALGVIGAT